LQVFICLRYSKTSWILMATHTLAHLFMLTLLSIMSLDIVSLWEGDAP
jgi:hypothetical protein